MISHAHFPLQIMEKPMHCIPYLARLLMMGFFIDTTVTILRHFEAYELLLASVFFGMPEKSAIASFILVLGIAAQLLGTVMILAKKRAEIACIALAIVLLVEVRQYHAVANWFREFDLI